MKSALQIRQAAEIAYTALALDPANFNDPAVKSAIVAALYRTSEEGFSYELIDRMVNVARDTVAEALAIPPWE